MKLVITISCDNSAFNGKDCGRELARILQIVTDRVDLESKSDLIRGYHDDPKSSSKHSFFYRNSDLGTNALRCDVHAAICRVVWLWGRISVIEPL
jgi:hypothetical protein